MNAVKGLDGIKVVSVSDRTFLMHKGGKIEVVGKVPIKTRDDLSMAYTPGVARVSSGDRRRPGVGLDADHQGPHGRRRLGRTAVLGLGDIGPEAAMPVMEGKAMLFKEFGGSTPIPICISTTDVGRDRQAVGADRAHLRWINLEDISAPRCFEIERRLKESLDIPVFHDDQHGTAVVVLAALLNALRVVGKRAEDVRVVVVGAGAAGLACAKIILEHGVRDLISCDINGILHPDRGDLTGELAAMAERSNPRRIKGTANDALVGADVVVGVSAPGAFTAEAVKTMARDAIVFAMANPTPEVEARGVLGSRRDHGHRPQRLPEPDQQRAGVPGHLPRRAGTCGPAGSTRR